LSRWTLLLEEKNFKINHCPGKDSPLNALSRHPVDRDSAISINQPIIYHISVPPTLPANIITILKQIAPKSEKRKEAHNKRINSIKYKHGDIVLVYQHKLSNALYKHIYKFFLL